MKCTLDCIFSGELYVDAGGSSELLGGIYRLTLMHMNYTFYPLLWSVGRPSAMAVM